jgi:putative SOS response-associated peptidase YedK
MCSRFSLTSPAEALSHLFGCVPERTDYPARYNIAPTDPILIVRRSDRGDRQCQLVRWGLIPSWVKDPRQFSTLINARAETVTEKPSFRGAIRHRRCLVPADGFYEWTGEAGAKQPHLIADRSGAVLAFAGIWETWLGNDGSEIETAAILTTAANADMIAIHDRMPLFLAPQHFDAWLDCRSGSATSILALLEPPPAGMLVVRRVSRRLNNPRSDGPDLLTPD